VTIDLPDTMIAAIADAVAARLGAPAATDGERLVGPRDVGVSPRSWRRAVREGALPAFRVGRTLLARRADVDRWLGGLAAAATLPVEGDRCSISDRSDVGAAGDDEIDDLLAAGRLRVLPGGARR